MVYSFFLPFVRVCACMCVLVVCMPLRMLWKERMQAACKLQRVRSSRPASSTPLRRMPLHASPLFPAPTQSVITYASPRKIVYKEMSFATYSAINHTNVITEDLSQVLGPRDVGALCQPAFNACLHAHLRVHAHSSWCSWSMVHPVPNACGHLSHRACAGWLGWLDLAQH